MVDGRSLLADRRATIEARDGLLLILASECPVPARSLLALGELLGTVDQLCVDVNLMAVSSLQDRARWDKLGEA